MFTVCPKGKQNLFLTALYVATCVQKKILLQKVNRVMIIYLKRNYSNIATLALKKKNERMKKIFKKKNLKKVK